ncbi:MAG: hypothetical protein AAF581_15040 [Planctomycetota bacterium]
MSNELLRVIQETNRRNHMRRQNSAFSSAGRPVRPATTTSDSYEMLDDLESRLSAEIRSRVDQAMDQVAAHLASQSVRAADNQPNLKTEEIVYQDAPQDLSSIEEQLRDHLDAISRSTQRSLRDGLASIERSLEEGLGANHGGEAADPEAHQHILEKLQALDEKLATPLVLDHENEVTPTTLQSQLQRIEEQLQAMGEQTASVEPLDMSSLDLSVLDLSGIQESIAAELRSAQPVTEESLQEVVQALSGVTDLRKAQDTAGEQLTELKRDFSHLVLTLNSHLEESRDKTQQLVTEFGKLLTEEFQLDQVKDALANRGDGDSSSADVIQVLEKLNRLDERLQELPQSSGTAMPQTEQLIAKMDKLQKSLGKNPKAAGRQHDATELVAQLRRDFSLLVKAFNSHLEESRSRG